MALPGGHEVYATFRCMAKRRPDGFRDHDTAASLIKGDKTCPLNEETLRFTASSPADNIAGPEAATLFSQRYEDGKCPLCKKKIEGYDFYITFP
jgi:hypothetical protein